MKNVMNWIRVFVINVLVLFCLIVILELGWIAYDNTLRTKTSCKPEWVLYNYCSDIKFTRLNHDSDGGELIEIQVDELGGRVQPGSKSTLSKAQNFIVGDSFIQADEIPYDKTIYGLWNSQTDNKVYALGYSSWNPIQYFDAIRRIGKTDSHYYVFLMTNDVMPSYDRSVSSELNYNKLSFIRDRVFYKGLMELKRRVLKFKEAAASHAKANPVEIVSDEFTTKKVQDCRALNQLIRSNYTSKIGFDYLVFSKDYDCWPQIQRKAFDEFSSVVREIESYITTNLSSQITFVWVGAGWAHKKQNSIGRQSTKYSYSPEISITQKGLVDAFRKRFPNPNILDTEEVIARDLALCSDDCVDKYYSAVDGHWTPYTHSLILPHLNR